MTPGSRPHASHYGAVVVAMAARSGTGVDDSRVDASTDVFKSSAQVPEGAVRCPGRRGGH